MANRRTSAATAGKAKKETEITNTAPAEQTNMFTEAQVQDMIAKAVAEAMAKQQTEAKTSPHEGMVTLRFFDEVNDANVIYLGENGKYGQIVGKRWMGQIPKLAFIGDLRTPLIQKLLEDRNLIVMDGLTDDERRLYNVTYHDGEFVDEKLYERMIHMPEADLLEIYRNMCPEWRRMVAVRFAEAYANGKLRVTRDALLALNRESKRDNKDLPAGDPRKKGAFWGIIQAMNIAEDESAD